MTISWWQRVKVAWAIICGLDEAKFGPRTVCPDTVKGDRSPAFHQASWRLDISTPSMNCDGSIRIRR